MRERRYDLLSMDAGVESHIGSIVDTKRFFETLDMRRSSLIELARRGADRRRFGLAPTAHESLHEHEEQRHEEDAEERTGEHAADHAGADRALRAGARAVRERERQHAEAERHRGHDDRAQTVVNRSHPALDL